MAVRPHGRWRSGTLAGLIEQPHQTDLLRGPKTFFVTLRTLQSKYMFMGGINEDTVYISIQCRNDDDAAGKIHTKRTTVSSTLRLEVFLFI